MNTSRPWVHNQNKENAIALAPDDTAALTQNTLTQPMKYPPKLQAGRDQSTNDESQELQPSVNDKYIFPEKYMMRQYQINILRVSMNKNTLVQRLKLSIYLLYKSNF